MRQRSRDVTPPHVDHNCQIIAASGDEPLFSRPPFRRDAWLIPLYDFPFSDVKSIKGFLSKQPRVRGPREARGWSTRGGEVWVSRRGEGGGRDGGGLSLIPPPQPHHNSAVNSSFRVNSPWSITRVKCNNHSRVIIIHGITPRRGYYVWEEGRNTPADSTGEITTLGMWSASFSLVRISGR